MTGEREAAEDPGSQAFIRADDKTTLQRWSAALGVTTEALESAIQAVGPRVDRVKDYLTGGMAGDQEDA